MTKRRYIEVLLVCLPLLTAGCAPTVQPRVSQTEFLSTSYKIPAYIELFVSEAFRSYKAEKTDISELKNWNFELGPVSVDALRFALQSRFEDVSVTLGSPNFPVKGPEVFYAAIEPQIAHFAASDPVLFKFENYTAEIRYDIKVSDRDGTVIHQQTYPGKGVEQGSIGFADPGHAAYPVAIQKAVKAAAQKFVNDLSRIAKE